MSLRRRLQRDTSKHEHPLRGTVGSTLGLKVESMLPPYSPLETTSGPAVCNMPPLLSTSENNILPLCYLDYLYLGVCNKIALC